MKKRVLSGLLAFVMLLSALPMGVYAAETRYSVAASPDQTTDVGKTVSMTVSVSGGKYNAYDLVLTYDTARLTYVSGQAADKGASVTEKSGSIRVIGYGADKAASTAADKSGGDGGGQDFLGENRRRRERPDQGRA